MSAKKPNSSDFKSLASSAKNGGVNAHNRNTLKPLDQLKKQITSSQSLLNPHNNKQNEKNPSEAFLEIKETVQTDFVGSELKKSEINGNDKDSAAELSFSEQQKQKKQGKKAEKDFDLLSGDRWLERLSLIHI